MASASVASEGRKEIMSELKKKFMEKLKFLMQMRKTKIKIRKIRSK